jgi:predicted RNA-binding protein associated with RNAse of E/G family
MSWRPGQHVFWHYRLTSDHVLDVWVAANGDVELKDEDELAAAVEHGRFAVAEGQQIQHDARAAISAFRAARRGQLGVRRDHRAVARVSWPATPWTC